MTAARGKVAPPYRCLTSGKYIYGCWELGSHNPDSGASILNYISFILYALLVLPFYTHLGTRNTRSTNKKLRDHESSAG